MDFGTTASEAGTTVALPGPGDCRIRGHGKGRDAGDPRGNLDPVEEYPVQVQGWAAPYDEPALHKAADSHGMLWRE